MICHDESKQAKHVKITIKIKKISKTNRPPNQYLHVVTHTTQIAHTLHIPPTSPLIPKYTKNTPEVRQEKKENKKKTENKKDKKDKKNKKNKKDIENKENKEENVEGKADDAQSLESRVSSHLPPRQGKARQTNKCKLGRYVLYIHRHITLLK